MDPITPSSTAGRAAFRSTRPVKALLAVLILLVPLRVSSAPESPLSPAAWPPEERGRYATAGMVFGYPRPLSMADAAMIGGTSGPTAVHVGLRTLQQGGTAADAGIATALAQVVLDAGAWNSYAGILYCVYYDGDSRTVHALNAGYNTVLGETDPAGIPSRPTPSGRTAMVPGFMSGVEALHRRFGRLPLADLLAPAVDLAENGVPVDPTLGRLIESRRDVLTRLPGTSKVFTRPDGQLYRSGDLLQQPALAGTLRRVAEQGVQYMSTGQWAERLVAAVQADGGKLSMGDMRRYAAEWEAPLTASYHGCRVHTLPPPELGGVQVIEALSMVAHAGLREVGHPSQSAEALYRFTQICRFGPLMSYLRPAADPAAPHDALAPARRADPARAPANLERIREKGWQSKLYQEIHGPASHSDAVVAADAEGNAIALVHSINTTTWGTTGLFVDGVSIPDSASFQQHVVASVPPGSRFPNAVNPVVVTCDGRPVLVAGCIGSGLHHSMVQNLVNVLEFDMDPRTSLDQPSFLGGYWSRTPLGNPGEAYLQEMVERDRYPAEILQGLRERGQSVRELDSSEFSGKSGHWLGVRIHSEAPRLRGAVDAGLNGLVEGY